MSSNKKTVNLIYYKDRSIHGNFGDELSKFITASLLNTNKYNLSLNDPNKAIQLVCIGSYIHMAKNLSFIYGSGVRTPNNIENGHRYKTLNVFAVRGPLTREFLLKKNIKVPEIYGDPALLLPKFYTPNINLNLQDKIGIIPHKSNYHHYINNYDNTKFYLINPTNKWQNVIDHLCSCKAVISSSLHGLICSDAYGIPNLWLDEYKIQEGHFKFKDYFLSQSRPNLNITKLQDFNDSLLYDKGNTIDLEKLINAFPFK